MSVFSIVRTDRDTLTSTVDRGAPEASNGSVPSFVVTAEDREWYARCRRAWNLGALARRGLESPDAPSPRRRVERALRDGLAVHYLSLIHI